MFFKMFSIFYNFFGDLPTIIFFIIIINNIFIIRYIFYII